MVGSYLPLRDLKRASQIPLFQPPTPPFRFIFPPFSSKSRKKTPFSLIFSSFHFVLSFKKCKIAFDSRGQELRYRKRIPPLTHTQRMATHAEPTEVEYLREAGERVGRRESRHIKKASSSVLSLTLGNLANYQRLSQGRGNKDVLGMCLYASLSRQPQCLLWSVQCKGVQYSYRRGLSALLVQLNRAMQEPPSVGRAPEEFPRFLFMPK